MKLNADELHDSDSDLEQAPTCDVTVADASGADCSPSLTEQKEAPRLAPRRRGSEDVTGQALGQEPDQEVISTIIVDCVGDCIFPRLTVDKKQCQEERLDNDTVNGCPVFKFIHSAVAPPMKRSLGAVLGGEPGGAPLPG